MRGNGSFAYCPAERLTIRAEDGLLTGTVSEGKVKVYLAQIPDMSSESRVKGNPAWIPDIEDCAVPARKRSGAIQFRSLALIVRMHAKYVNDEPTSILL